MKQRRVAPERMDALGHEAEVLRESLNQVAQVNRFLGGTRAVLRALRPYVERSYVERPNGKASSGPAGSGSGADPAPLRLLDVGTGNAELPLRLLEWRGARGIRWKLVGLDRHPEIAPIAAARAAASGDRLSIVQGDALRLPFKDGSFDIVLCTLVLHHFEDDAAVDLVREMARVSSRAVLVNDLERGRSALLGARFLAATLWRGNRLTSHDGPISVEAAFTREELLRVGRDAGLRDASVRRHFPFRLLLHGKTGRGKE